MITLWIPDLNIPTDLGWEHEATSWKLAKSPLFRDEDIVFQSLNDIENKRLITIDIDLDSGTTYYAQAQVICNKGIFDPSNIEIIDPKNYINISLDYNLPTVVNRPDITLDFDESNFPPSLFRIRSSEFSSTGSGKHKSTTYIIKDVDNNVIYSRIDDRENLTELLVDDIILEYDKPYIILLSHRSDSNDVSEFATKVVIVNDVKEIVLKSTTEEPDISDGYTVVLNPIENLKKLYIKLYKIGVNDSEEVYNGESTTTSLIIPYEVFRDSGSTRFILAIEIEYNSGVRKGPKYYKLKTSI